MSSRRLLCCLLFASVCHASMANASSQYSWDFEVSLGDKVIGYHRFELSRQNDMTYVSSEASFSVNFLFFNAYRYQHNNHEVWQGECLHSIQSQTNDNGKIIKVNGDRHNGILNIKTTGEGNILQGCINTFAYWNIDFLNNDRLLNAQTGELIPVTVKQLGTTTIIVRGEPTDANHYRLIAEEFNLELWYAVEDREWLALQSTTSDGAVLRYNLL